MTGRPQDDPSAMADEVLDEDPPFHPPVEAASEPAESSLAHEGDAVEDQVQQDPDR